MSPPRDASQRQGGRRAQRSSEPRVAFCWDVQGDLYWFHYASAESARAIAAERFYVVSSRGHQQHGPGLFLTSRNPLELSEEELLVELFALQRMPEDVGGVLILRRDDNLLPVRKVGYSSYLHAAQPGDVIDLAPVYRGYGIREADGSWLFTQSVHAVK